LSGIFVRRDEMCEVTWWSYSPYSLEWSKECLEEHLSICKVSHDQCHKWKEMATVFMSYCNVALLFNPKMSCLFASLNPRFLVWSQTLHSVPNSIVQFSILIL